MANVRELVLKGLYRMEKEGAYHNQTLLDILSEDLDARDKGFASELLGGVVRNRLKLDYIIEKFSKIKLKKLSPWVHQILRMGVYQIMNMERVPDSAACNESVKLARKYAHGAAQGYVNGLLRSVSREKENIEYPKQSLERLSIIYSCPQWLTAKLIEQYGEETCEQILESSHKKQPVSIRVNTLKTTREKLLKRLSEEGLEARADIENSKRIYIDGAINVYGSKAYLDGDYTLQNSSSMEAVEMLSPKEGETVLDLCAAPGGKTTYIAESMGNKGKIFAMDIHPHKMELIENSAKRLGISIVETFCGDAGEVRVEWLDLADRVLADVPCSGIGVIHKKPDIKWHRCESDIEELCAIQKKILKTASGYVKTGGTLVYSTCTILKEENQVQVAEFLKENPDFTLEEEKLLLTHITGGSGFYIAKLVKQG